MVGTGAGSAAVDVLVDPDALAWLEGRIHRTIGKIRFAIVGSRCCPAAAAQEEESGDPVISSHSCSPPALATVSSMFGIVRCCC
jgi:hypothetical protein